jgi:hypothetical protein
MGNCVLLKEGVYGDLNPQIRRAKREIHKLHNSYGVDLVITSKRDGTHGFGSCHPEGDAFDFRKVDMITELNIIEALAGLGPGYDLIEHDTHWHLEYDPK